MRTTSEFVSPGHPDKVADYISSYLLDRYIERDPRVRYAVEVQIKDSFVTLGGEVTSACQLPFCDMLRHVRDAVCEIGYTPDYAKRWGADNCIDPDALLLVAHIGQQSPDIAQGVDADGWGDQGIFWGMATGDASTGYFPRDIIVAKQIGWWLYNAALGGRLPVGLDIKTQVTVDDGRVTGIVVAAPAREADLPAVTDAIMAHVEQSGIHGAEVTINGTGAYVRHASAGDCGTTGRKLAVDFYGGNCRIGGGSPWTKDPSKADVTLNVYARRLAVAKKKQTGEETVYCAISCCIGRRDIDIVYFDGSLRQIGAEHEARPASEIISELGLGRPVWASKCRYGLFSNI